MVSAVLCIPTFLAFASQHYEWRHCLLGCPCQLLCDLHSFRIKKNKALKSGGGCEAPQLSSTQVCLPYIFYLPVQDKANIFDKFRVKYKWPSLDTNTKSSSEASRIAARPSNHPISQGWQMAARKFQGKLRGYCDRQGAQLSHYDERAMASARRTVNYRPFSTSL